MAMQSHKLLRVGEEVVKVASKPTVIEHIEKDVEAGIPRKDETLGQEGASNIDVPMANPSIPRGNAEMGQESASNINPAIGLPDVAVDSSYMGDEAKQLEGTPAMNNEIKGTVIAEGDAVTKEAKKMKEVETVEGDVEAGIPRADATLGHEGKDNVDVDAGSPDIPRGDAKMGEEGADNIDVKADAPDIPIDNATMGHEDETLKGTPAINDEYLKQVQQSTKKDRQLERLSNARQMEAIKVASKLVATERVTEEAYDNVVQALSQFEIDKISSVADSMYPARQKREAATQDTGHAIPAIVQESKGITKTASADAGETLQSALENQFTIGSHKFDEKLKEWDEK
jgi:hypothetical protein